MRVDFASVVRLLGDGDRPTGELSLVTVSHFGESRPTFECYLPILLVKTNKAVAVSSFLLVLDVLGVGVCVHANRIAEAILKVTRPRQWAVRDRIRTGLFIERMPPATVDRVHYRWTREAEGAVAKLLDTMFHNDGKMLIAAQMRSPRATHFQERTFASGLWPAIAVEIGKQATIAASVHVDGSTEGRCG